MASAITELVLFLASPSDVVEERAAVRAVVDETNSVLADSGVRFRVAGWEHTQPGAGRPQGLINPEVERCDMFVGLLNRRWGSATGEFSSGFEEEYTLAQRLCDSSDAPSIHLFFADLASTLLEDPGISLKRVLAFKKRIISERKALFRSFTDSHDLARQIQALLFSKALESLELNRHSTDAGTSASEEPSASAPAGIELDDARAQMSSVLQSLADMIRGDRDSGDFFDQDRLELIARAFGKDRDEIGSHFANRLFRRRGEIVLSVGEANLWLHTLLSDVGRYEPGDRTIPGWAALVGDLEAGLDELVSLAASGAASVARGAVRVMAEHDLRPSVLFGSDSNPTDDRLAQVTKQWVGVLNAQPGASEALDYFLRSFDLNTPVAEAVLEAETLHPDTVALLSAARSATGGDPGKLASESAVIGFSRRGNRELRRILTDHLDCLSDEELREVVRRGDGEDLRVPAAEIGLRRGILDAKQLGTLIDKDDASLTGRLVDLAVDDPGVAKVLLGAESARTRERFSIQLMSRVSERDALVAAREEKPWQTAAWGALLVNPGPEEISAARKLIDTDASDLRESVRAHLKDHDDLVDFVVQEQVSLAGICLADRLHEATEADASRIDDLTRVIRAEQMSDRLKRLTFIQRVASAVRTESAPEMALVEPWLVKLAGDMYRHEREAIFAGPLAATMAGIAETSGDAITRAAALRWRASRPAAEDDELLEFIYDDDSDVRMAAIANLISRWDATRLSELLDTYAERGRPYWYNIIVAIDDHLYSRPQ